MKLQMEPHRCTFLVALVFLIFVQIADSNPASFVKELHKTLKQVKHSPTEPDLVIKKAYDKPSRMVFVAGVEGTGHHAMRSFFDVCVLSDKHPECEMEIELSKKLMLYDEEQKRLGGIFGTKLAHDSDHQTKYSTTLKDVVKRMNELSVMNTNHLSVVGLSYGNWLGAESGMMSYPNYDGIDKALEVPDIVLLASLAESAGLDLRILVLYRTDVKALLKSYTRRFDMDMYSEAMVMISALSQLYAQMVLIDKRFIQCIHFESLTGRPSSDNSDMLPSLTEAEKEQLIRFIHPAVLQDVSSSMWETIKHQGDSPTSVTAQPKPMDENTSTSAASIEVNNLQAEYLFWRLRRQMSLVESYCKNV